MPGSFSLVTEDVEECAPTGVHDALREMVIFHHVRHLKVFNCNQLIALGVRFRGLEMVIAALPVDLQVRLRHVLRGFPASMAASLASAQLALLASQGSLRGTIEARVLNRVALTIREKGLETYINTDIRMLARARSMFGMWLRLTHDEGIPMPIRTQDQVDRFRRPLYRAMHLDLEGFPDLLGHDEVLLLLMQIRHLSHTAAVEWNAIGCLS